jgi:type II restriction enzyme
MDLALNIQIAKDYKNKAQIARVITENWVKENSYCPQCGRSHLTHFDNNKPVADFYCKACLEQYELKSKSSSKISHKIVNGAYEFVISHQFRIFIIIESTSDLFFQNP